MEDEEEKEKENKSPNTNTRRRSAKPMRGRRAGGNNAVVWTEAEDDEEELLPRGLGTNLYNKKHNRPTAPSSIDLVEDMCDEFDRITNQQLNTRVLYEDTRPVPEFDKNFLKCMESLKKEEEWVLIQTDKTNRWAPMPLEEYIHDMEAKMAASCIEIATSELD